MATLSGIYQWISDNFPYYKTAGNGWKESLFYTVTIRFVRRVFVVNSCKFLKFPQPGLKLGTKRNLENLSQQNPSARTELPRCRKTS